MIISIKQADRVVVGYTVSDLVPLATVADCIDPENISIKFAPSGHMIAFVRSGRSADLFLYDEQFENMPITPQAIAKDTIAYIKRKLKQNNQPLGKHGDWDNMLIICDSQHIYTVNTQFDFREEGDYIAVGPDAISGTLKSVLDATTDLYAEDRMVKALDIVAKVHKQNLYPLVVTDSKTQQFKVIHKGA